ncbi:MAG: Mur ligase domain-containing protein, partial [Ferruginibacter sp.]|nr:Mur ligase domain-containing protein [Ferruginibacter sp.]
MLKDLLYKVNLKAVWGSTDVEINSLHIDSRGVKPISCFIAVKGSAVDGHNFIDAAIKNGAIVIVAEQL